jgi:hypothetical protein
MSAPQQQDAAAGGVCTESASPEEIDPQELKEAEQYHSKENFIK